jgi:D-beta-D-heptose 7-phosphate kinase/D-beta-D-heptose 1-phosphate adenosyltransferase
MKTVAVSGYFDPPHIGHARLFQHARSLGDKLIVILNNDTQQRLKGTIPFYPIRERIELLMAIKGVSNVVVSIDTDGTVCKTLALLKPDIFANGGDRRRENTPENEVCSKYGIRQVWNIGGNKVNSSSKAIYDAAQKAMGDVPNAPKVAVSLGENN